MNSRVPPRRSVVADALYGLLNPVPFGCFVAALIFDAAYAGSGVMLWVKGASWLLMIGLIFAIVPRIINLVQTWITSRHYALRADRSAFWLNLVAIVVAIVNAFVHTRDAYAVMPTGLWLSILTVLLLSIGHVLVAIQPSAPGAFVHD